MRVSLTSEHNRPQRLSVITNPHFNLALGFALRGIELACEGVALLVRGVWLEGTERYLRSCERVSMTKGRWDPDASTATA